MGIGDLQIIFERRVKRWGTLRKRDLCGVIA
jgi:hypothetical protein